MWPTSSSPPMPGPRRCSTLPWSTAPASAHDTRSLRITPGVALKPAANVFIQLSPGYHWDQTSQQYVTAVDDPTATAFYGRRYVFGFIETTTLSLSTRVNWTFTPDLTLQLFAQPFIASGDYSSFREFAAPRTMDKLVYGDDIGAISYDEDASEYMVDPDGEGPAEAFTFGIPTSPGAPSGARRCFAGSTAPVRPSTSSGPRNGPGTTPAVTSTSGGHAGTCSINAP